MLKLHLIGDSNVDRYIAVVKAAKEDPAIHETTFARATNLVQLKEALCILKIMKLPTKVDIKQETN